MTILPNAIYRFNAIPIKLPMAFFTELEQNILQFVWKHKRPWIAKAVLRKKNGAGVINFLTSDYTTKLQSSREYVLVQRQKYRPMEQDRKPRDTPTHLIFDKGSKNIQWGKDSLFNKWCWEHWTATCKRMKLEHFLTPHTKLNSKWIIKVLNVRPETIKLLEENIGRTLDDINQSKNLYDPPPRVMEIKTKVKKWDLIKLKSFCTAKETISKVKDNPQNGRK